MVYPKRPKEYGYPGKRTIYWSIKKFDIEKREIKIFRFDKYNFVDDKEKIFIELKNSKRGIYNRLTTQKELITLKKYKEFYKDYK